LAANTIKNFVAQRCDEIGADVDAWGDSSRQDLTMAGGATRSRRVACSDLGSTSIPQHWLTMRVKDEIPTDMIFDWFREHACEDVDGKRTAGEFLARLHADVDTFRDLAQLDRQRWPTQHSLIQANTHRPFGHTHGSRLAAPRPELRSSLHDALFH
jgi:hypothetical protein